jgi:hypothetical protein
MGSTLLQIALSKKSPNLINYGFFEVGEIIGCQNILSQKKNLP